MNWPLALFTGAPGMMEILIILIVLFLFFGAKRLPELSRSLGRSIQEFKKGRREGEETEPRLEKHAEKEDEDKR
jgi:sec-independent protein translocase protein TatA